MHVKKGDKVMVLTGKDKGKTGTVLAAFPKKERVLVEGVNIVKKHAKPSQENPQGGIFDKEAAIHVSNVMVIDPKTNEPTRIGYKKVTIKGKDGIEKVKSVRVSKKSGEVLDTDVKDKIISQ
ncbi:50S ribosomal protein L24 [Siminovitchia fortis]|uniref:Large ribosomal subunit protein uL24 n=1 Tax=Siminovitchia fortis TaxID=254758 RepID=A0A443ITD4_9BACI|nr:50S ribosomal protein L24 [Siminovitchia fortis]RWR10627.1 50S ribosomal protein L24 [Siminovitchia fortis]WHY81263.1 50S ribosomal protein L24 [Siminovitchia fortis]